MTDEELRAIKERAERATPGPWHWHYPHGGGTLFDPDNEFVAFSNTSEDIDGKESDLQFIAASRTDIPTLLAEIARLRRDIEELKLVNKVFRAGIGKQ